MSEDSGKETVGEHHRLGRDDGSIRGDSKGTLHIEVDGGVAFTRHGERRVVLCGAVLSGGSLPLNGTRLADEHRKGNVCETCLDRLRDENATIPGFMSNGEVLR